MHEMLMNRCLFDVRTTAKSQRKEKKIKTVFNKTRVTAAITENYTKICIIFIIFETHTLHYFRLVRFCHSDDNHLRHQFGIFSLFEIHRFSMVEIVMYSVGQSVDSLIAIIYLDDAGFMTFCAN